MPYPCDYYNTGMDDAVPFNPVRTALWETHTQRDLSDEGQLESFGLSGKVKEERIFLRDLFVNLKSATSPTVARFHIRPQQ